MKQKFLSILSLVMITAVTANAQVATNYRGAFAPAPVAMWTDNWTNWDPQNTFYRAVTDSVQGKITTSQTWTKDKVYLLKGLVYIDTLVTLTIEPGTIVRGDANTIISTLIVQRGGKLIANGTPCEPIVFTSSKASGARLKGDWGGITMLGRAVNNVGLNVSVEGIIDNGTGESQFGGNDNADNSGSLKYVRIEYAGYPQAVNKELNSLTLGSVGSATTIDYVQVSFANDDAYEWFGGTVNCSHLVAYRTHDDDLDVDMGYSGIVQFALSVKDPAVSDLSDAEGFESDNGGSSTAATFVTTPRTSAKFYNVTQIGGFRCSSNAGTIQEPTSDRFVRGARLRRGSKIEIYNSILMNNYVGLEMTTEGNTQANIPNPGVDAVFQNNIVAMDTNYTSTTARILAYSPKAKFYITAATKTYMEDAANRNSVIGTPCALLTRAWDFTNPDYRPNAAGAGAALAGTDLSTSGNIESALFGANQTVDFSLDLFENGAGNSNGTITVLIPVSTGFNVNVPGLTLTATPQAGTDGNLANLGADYTNSNWLFSFDGTNYIITSKVGYSIPKSGQATLGFRVQRKSTTPAGFQSLSFGVSGGSDNNAANNDGLTGVTAL